jgi:hypothetical protein
MRFLLSVPRDSDGNNQRVGVAPDLTALQGIERPPCATSPLMRSPSTTPLNSRMPSAKASLKLMRRASSLPDESGTSLPLSVTSPRRT